MPDAPFVQIKAWDKNFVMNLVQVVSLGIVQNQQEH